MIYYIYDGSFEGLLTSIYDSFYRREYPDKIVSDDNFQPNLLIEAVHIKTDSEKASKVYNSIKNKISSSALENIFYVFLSEVENNEKIIYNYLRLGWKLENKIDLYLSDDRVLTVHKIVRRVKNERHRMLGLIRFRYLDKNTYYAPIEPQYNIIGLVAPHFTKRLSDQNWIIHDVNRKIAAVYDKREWYITDFKLNRELKYSDEEIFFQDLWKQYFNSIAIKNRINPRLQKRNMPMKYWKYLIEKS
jgi:probable DNA metabolism protein